jgi:hypothetical protein
LDLPVLLSVAVFRIPLAAGKYSFPQPTEGVQITAKVLHIETREGWPLLTVEFDVNGNSKSSLGLSWRYKRFLFSLGCSIATQYESKLLQFLCPHRPGKLNRQQCWVAYLLVCVSGFSV